METQSPPLNPWLSIWTKPRLTIRQILNSPHQRSVIVLGMLAGISRILDRASFRSLGDRASLTTILIVSLVLGPLLGLISLYIGAALLRWAGSWRGGRASQAEVRTALAWASVPVIVGLALWIPKLVLFGQELFTTATPRLESNPVLALLYLAFEAIDLTLTVWALVIFLHCLGEVHHFSAWKALSVTLLAFLVILVPLLLLVFGLILLFG